MGETDLARAPHAGSAERRRLDQLEAMLDAALGQVLAQGVAVDLLLKALASIDRQSGAAIAMALDVAEMDLADRDGETETVLALRRIREQLSHALPPEPPD